MSFSFTHKYITEMECELILLPYKRGSRSTAKLQMEFLVKTMLPFLEKYTLLRIAKKTSDLQRSHMTTMTYFHVNQNKVKRV